MGASNKKNQQQQNQEIKNLQKPLQQTKGGLDSMTDQRYKGKIYKSEIDRESKDQQKEEYQQIANIYTIINSPIKQGFCGEVRYGIHQATGVKRAIKFVKQNIKNRIEYEMLMKEIEILQQLDHPNILRVLQFYEDYIYYYIVTQVCTGSELIEQINSYERFTQRDTCDIICQLLSAVSYCHKNKLIHRDIRPENIQFDSNQADSQLKLIDFASPSQVYSPLQHQQLTQRLNKPLYVAPEVLVQKKCTEQSDMWSIGVILFTLLCGEPPFNSNSDDKILKLIHLGQYSMDSEEWVVISKEAQNFISKLLEYDPVKRYSASQALKDPWIKKYEQRDDSQVNLINLKDSLNKLRKFSANQKLEQALYIFIINILATQEEKAQLLTIYQALDQNGDGKLCKEQLIEGFKQIQHEYSIMSLEDAIQVIEKLDQNKKGEIDFTEFVISILDKQNFLTHENKETAFRMIDTDQSGYLSLEEIVHLFDGIDCIDQEYVKDIMSQVDINEDQKLSLQEFKLMLVKLME